MRLTLAAFHYLALAIGFCGVFMRGLELRELRRAPGSLNRLFLADNLWGVAAVLWIVTGLGRAFGQVEKGSAYYLSNQYFWLKMAMFGAVFAIEIHPMITFIRWRMKKKTSTDAQDAALIQKYIKINDIETALILLIPFVAVAMSRWIW